MRSLACLALAVLLVCCPGVAYSQLLGFGNDRSHPELRWKEFETEHFVLVYPEHLEQTALEAATIAEQVYEPITRGLQVEMPRKTSIVLSDEDQIVNGFALPGKMFVWVNVNDYAGRFGGFDHWLRGVIAHEFQHNVWFEAAKDWLGVFLFRTPLWFIEGLAEYETEEWGAGRSDLELREKFLRNRHTWLDPHDSGFSKVRYMAEQYGDSTQVRAVKKRNFLGLSDFGKGFEEAAGISLSEFEEEWRRVATAHTYAIYSQKEAIGDVGEHVEPPARDLVALRYAAGGQWLATLSRSAGSLPVLAFVKNDSTRERQVVDHGYIHSDFGIDAEGRRVVYAKLHRSHHGSLLWDLKVADRQTGRSEWITSGRRASHPAWSPTEELIVFTAIDGSTTNLYTCNALGGDVRRLSHHAHDTQILSPYFSPDGSQVVYSSFEPGRGVNIALLDLSSGRTRYLTHAWSHDLRPLWTRDSSAVVFTSDRNRDEVPNLFTVPTAGAEENVDVLTDVGESLHGLDIDPGTNQIVARAMASTDTLRLRSISPKRRTQITDPVINTRFVGWRDRVPPNPIPEINYDHPPPASPPRTYRAWRHMRPLFWYVLPSFQGWGLQGGTMWMDVAHRNRLFLAGSAGYDHREDRFDFFSFYGNYETNRLPLHLPGWLTVSGGPKSDAGVSLYAGELLLDERSALHMRYRKPFNFGEHLYANHNVELGYELQQIDVLDFEDLDFAEIEADRLPTPEPEYREDVLSLTYRYTKKRPHSTVFGHARHGHGLLARFALSDERLGSDFSYRRLLLDTSKSLVFPFGGLFLRSRYERTWGRVPAQDFTGLRGDPPLLPVTYQRTPLFDDIFHLREHFFLRGSRRNVVGDQALSTTVEWRIPLLPPLPVSAFGLTPGGVTGTLFYDHGRVWKGGGLVAGLHTVGWELRVPLVVFGELLFVPSYGEGQTLKWEIADREFARNEYFRLAMVQPF